MQSWIFIPVSNDPSEINTIILFSIDYIDANKYKNKYKNNIYIYIYFF